MKRVLLTLGLIGLLLTVSGCLFPFNLVVEGPEGKLAVVLGPERGYEPFPTGGAVWLLDASGALERPLLELGEREGAGDLAWSPSGDELLGVVLEVEGEFMTPKEWRLLRLPLEGEPEVLLRTEYPLTSPTYTQTGSAVLYIAAPEEAPELHRLDLVSGEDELVEKDILTYLPFHGEVLAVSSAGEFKGPDGDTLASFSCSEEDCQLFLLLWPKLFLDISPTGEFLGLVVADRPGLTTPEVDPVTSLYLVNLEEGTAERLATPALSPSFSPDGTKLAFTAGTPDGKQFVYVHDLDSQETTQLPGSEGAFWVRWGQTGIIAAVEDEEGRDRLLRWDGAGWREIGFQPGD